MITSNQAPSQARRTNRLAIGALVCGIVGIWLFPAWIIAIILGHKARREIRQTGEDGSGLATAGLILGYIGIILLIGGTVLATVSMTG